MATVALHTTSLALQARPTRRGQCVDGPRPCPWVSCRHHLLLAGVTKGGELQIRHDTDDPLELAETCSLDVADRTDGLTLDEVALLLGVVKQRVGQIEIDAVSSMRLLLRGEVDALGAEPSSHNFATGGDA